MAGINPKIIKRTRIGLEVELKLPSGKVITFPANDEKEMMSLARGYMRDYKEDNKAPRYIPTNRRTPTYKQLSARKRINRAYTEKEVKKIGDAIYVATTTGAIVAHKRTLDQIAEELLKQTLFSAEFNEYTGNLYNSYQTTVISNGKVTNVYRPKPHTGYVMQGGRRKRGVWIKKGNSRWSPLMKERHRIKVKSQGPRLPGMGNKSRKSGDGIRIRFLKSYEKNPTATGYSDLGMQKSIGNGARNPQFRIGRMQQGGGDGLVRSGIVVENTAPYADAVNLRYNVLKHSTERRVHSKYGGKGANLVRIMTKRMLKDAGFNVK